MANASMVDCPLAFPVPGPRPCGPASHEFLLTRALVLARPTILDRILLEGALLRATQQQQCQGTLPCRRFLRRTTQSITRSPSKFLIIPLFLLSVEM